MNITIESFSGSERFNVCLASKEGAQPFLTIKGCKLMDGAKGEWISWPATKNEKTGKWFNHCYASEGFQAAVIDAVKAAKPADTRTHAERKKLQDMPDDVPW